MNPAPELLAPAGSPEALRAAVQSGADAVYLGWGDFHARARAKGFTQAEFRDALVYCRQRGVRVYLTLNTLVSDRELPAALEQARTACRLGVDAVLVQDLGLLDLLRRVLPDLPLHASTQMSIFTTGGARLAREAGCRRIVAARECSKEDLARLCRDGGVEIEAFVHGALCMCYSGQCEMSAVIGGRSGNRGRCAQPCRMAYGANDTRYGANHAERSADHAQYALSLKDLNLARHIPELREIGVSCLKIEGRLRRAEYAAVVTEIYARLLRENRSPTREEEEALDLAFSRSGFTDGYWSGKTGASMFGTRSETGSAADSAKKEKQAREKEKRSEALFTDARRRYEKDDARTVPVEFICRIAAETPCMLTVTDTEGRAVTVAGPIPETAKTRPLTAEEVSARLRKTGGTFYQCRKTDIEIEAGLSLSASAINALRRDALAALTQARITPPKRRELEIPPLEVPPIQQENFPVMTEPRLTVSLSNASQWTAALFEANPARVFVPLEWADQLPDLPRVSKNLDSVERCVILPRVWRDRDEAELSRMLERAKERGFTGALIGNLGHIPLARAGGLRMYGDYGLNVFNARSLVFLREMGLQSVCLSFELRMAQIRDMKKIIPAEILVYGRLPLMITENRLQIEKRKADAKRSHITKPETDRAQTLERKSNILRDRTGAEFPLLDMYGGRTEIENSRPVWLADQEAWRRAGLSFARLRFTTETPEECARICRAYQNREAPPGSFTRGLYERGVE